MKVTAASLPFSFLFQPSLLQAMTPFSSSKTNTLKTQDSTMSTTTTSTVVEPCRAYPAHHWERLRQELGPDKVKLVHLVRHAEGTHNVNQQYKSESNVDARLTPHGFGQCQSLAARTRTRHNPEDICILTSPLTRCVQTALHSFPHLVSAQVPLVAHEEWRETVNYSCDRRRSIQEISEEFPQVNFDQVRNNQDVIWEDYRCRLGEDWEEHMESAELYRVAERGLQGLNMLASRRESEVVVCTHSAFLRCILNWGQEGGVPKLMPQRLDDRKVKTSDKLFDYCADDMLHFDGSTMTFERYMRRDFENCELRSCCLVFQEGIS